MRIAGLYNWHDGGYAVLEDGVVSEHIEFERYTRVKESGGDSLQYLKENYLEKNNIGIEDIDYFVSAYPDTNLAAGGGSTFSTHETVPKDKITFYPHHLCHAAHAFFSSNFKDALILTIDSEGLEDEGAVSTCGWIASDTKINKEFSILGNQLSIGKLWGRCTRFIFKLSSGYPRGHQAGSVMAMAALGDPEKYYNEFFMMATKDFPYVSHTPPGYKRGVYVPPEEDVIHPYLDRFRKIAEESEQEKFNMAAALQKVSEDILFNLIKQMHAQTSAKGFNTKNICLAGGVSLNSVFAGKIVDNFKGVIDNVFIPPVPYDGGLSIGACQYHWHSVLGNPRDEEVFVSPYLGEQYTAEDVESAIQEEKNNIEIKRKVKVDQCVDLIVDNKIISIFQGKSESGRRALGNRSILANPISPDMKNLINEKVKHRQWYRPFAPSILEDHGEEWFENFFPSPYMSFVFKFKEDKFGKAPAVEHFDKSARLQSVSRSQNKNYYNIIESFYEKTGVPILLNTSFNDREPIVENPKDAIKCFLSTDIDYLYFVEHEILISKANLD